MELKIPHNWHYRSYQHEFAAAMDSGLKRAALVWHRRAGKDKSALNWCVAQTQHRVGTYYEFFPTFQQGRKILWNGIDKEGFKFMDHFPKELIKRKREDDMLIELTNGSIWQIIGTDKMDHIVGTNPVGCIFSEWSIMNPRAWDLVQPILLENGGWGVFVYTPRGKNHGYRLAMMAENDPMWFYSHKTIADTKRDSKFEDGKRVMTLAQIDQLRREGQTSEDLIQQEYFCSWTGEMDAFFYSKEMVAAEREGRICEVPWIPDLPVYTSWDIGIQDGTAIWFIQIVGDWFHIIDYFENDGEGLPYYVKTLNQKPYVFKQVAGHIAPHDMAVRDWSTGKTRFEAAQRLGVNFHIVPKLPIGEGIDASRNILSRCRFDAEKCKNGIATLENYGKEWDDKRACYKKKPVHDWTSHGADAWRMFALGIRNPTVSGLTQVQALTEFDPMETLDPRKQMAYETEHDPYASQNRGEERGRQTHAITEHDPFK